MFTPVQAPARTYNNLWPSSAGYEFRSLIFSDRKYELRLANSVRELREIQAFRYHDFLSEKRCFHPGFGAHGLDDDPFDDQCTHLFISKKSSGDIVGTYRFQTYTQANEGLGFCSDVEFDLSHFPKNYLQMGLEVGRACIDSNHRNGRVLYLLWKGLMHALIINNARYLFGCCSIPSINPWVGYFIMNYLYQNDYLHPTVRLIARSDYICSASFDMFGNMNQRNYRDGLDFEIPVLLQKYLDLGGQVCSVPAIDHSFGSIDFVVLLDRFAIAPHVYEFFQRGLPITSDQILPSLL
jgi:putative hemolysin